MVCTIICRERKRVATRDRGESGTRDGRVIYYTLRRLLTGSGVASFLLGVLTTRPTRDVRGSADGSALRLRERPGAVGAPCNAAVGDCVSSVSMGLDGLLDRGGLDGLLDGGEGLADVLPPSLSLPPTSGNPGKTSGVDNSSYENELVMLRWGCTAEGRG